MVHSVSLGLVMFVLWLLLSGHYTAFVMGLGVASVVLVVVVARRMDVIDHEGHPIHLSWRSIRYWPWLIREIVKANWDVAKVIVQARMPISPSILCVEGTQKSELGNVIYANSITLTPGTVTISLEDGEFLVHALTAEAAAGIASGEMDLRVTDMENAKAGEDDPK